MIVEEVEGDELEVAGIGARAAEVGDDLRRTPGIAEAAADAVAGLRRASATWPAMKPDMPVTRTRPVMRFLRWRA
jgi:hypothetical protein